MSFTPSIIEQARHEIAAAPYGMRSVMAARWALLLNITPQTLNRKIGGEKRGRTSQPVNPEYREWTKVVFKWKKMPPDGAGEITTDQAVAMAVQAGELPEIAAEVPESTFNSIARQMGLNKKPKRRNRFQASRPNKTHHTDASSSKFMYVAKKDGNDYTIKLHRPGSGDYKNKPVPCDRLRPWYYGIVDDNSGRLYADITVAQGENMVDHLLVIEAAWEEMGTPEQLLADQGVLKKGLSSQDLFSRVDVAFPQMMPYAKEGHGKIERPWRTVWQRFEKTFFITGWEKYEITLAELRRRFQVFLADDYNQLPHRFEREISKMQAWSRINLFGGVVQFPKGALATVAKKKKRTIDEAGLLRYEGAIYEVKGLHAAEVYVYEGVFSDRLVVEDVKTWKKYEVRAFKPLDTGEFRAHAETPHEKLVKEAHAAQATGAGLLFQEKKAAAEKVVSMPIRTKEVRVVADPFDVDHYHSLREAMAEVHETVGAFIPPDLRKEVESIIVRNDLRKAFVIDLALELRASIEQSRQQMSAG